MKKIILYILVAMTVFPGCISNDLPYPVVVPNVVSVAAESAEKVDIDYNSRTVTLHFGETVDLRSVAISSVEFDSDVVKSSMNLVDIHDLSEPLEFTLTTYDRDYEWTIVAERPVERYFTVSGQVGSTVIDPVNLRAVVTVGAKTDIYRINVTSLKLGPEEITDYSMEMSDMTDFSNRVSVDVTAFGITQTWNLYVDVTDVTVQIKDVNPWACECYVTSAGIAGMDNGFMYRLKGDDNWTIVSDSDITSDGGTFVAHISGLKPDTTYEVMAYCGEDKTGIREFTTQSATQLPNSSFEHTSLVSGTNYYKFYDPDCGFEDGSYMFWGSGNGEGHEGVNGSANLNIIITYVDTQEKVDGKQSVRAETSQMAGMLAAGNIFTGQFAGLVGTSGGMVNFGRPWTTRPRAVKVFCKYQTDKMDIINGFPQGVLHTKDDYDRAEIKVALGIWSYRTYGGTPDCPVLINTTDASTFVNFNTDPSTIANGGVVIYRDGYEMNGEEKVNGTTDKWLELTIPLNYRDMETIPTHIIISCASSRYGDYFSGCSKSKLWLDDFELIY